MCLRCPPGRRLFGAGGEPAAPARRHALHVLQALALGAGLACWPASRAGPVRLPAPGPRDTCPVCGMFVAPYPYWIATVLWRDGPAVHFDGAKDFFKYLLDLKKYEPRRSRADIQALGVTDYYGGARIAAQGAHYVIGSDVLGPMGHELVPHESAEEAREFMQDHRGRRVLRFDEVTPALLKALDESRFPP
jgi:copper chaperone NosL